MKDDIQAPSSKVEQHPHKVLVAGSTPAGPTIPEIWEPIASLEGAYEVSQLGNIRTKSTGRTLKQVTSKQGYKTVVVKPYGKHGDSVCIRVHREVAIAFVPNPDDKEQVNHKDLCKGNNVFTNLEWVTAQENITHARAAGRITSKLSKEQVDYILTSNKTAVALSVELNVDRSYICKLRRDEKERIAREL